MVINKFIKNISPEMLNLIFYLESFKSNSDIINLQHVFAIKYLFLYRPNEQFNYQRLKEVV